MQNWLWHKHLELLLVLVCLCTVSSYQQITTCWPNRHWQKTCYRSSCQITFTTVSELWGNSVGSYVCIFLLVHFHTLIQHDTWRLEHLLIFLISKQFRIQCILTFSFHQLSGTHRSTHLQTPTEMDFKEVFSLQKHLCFTGFRLFLMQIYTQDMSSWEPPPSSAAAALSCVFCSGIVAAAKAAASCHCPMTECCCVCRYPPPRRWCIE